MDATEEDLIARLSVNLAPADREAFRRTAENVLAAAPECGWGPGSAYRAVASVWRTCFHAPSFEDHRPTWWDSGKKKTSKLILEGAKDGHRARRVR